MRARAVFIFPALAALVRAPAAREELFAGVLFHDVHLPVSKGGFEGGPEIELGYRSKRLAGLGFVGGPSLYVRGALAASGGTDFVSGGLSWRLGHGPVYVQPAFGIAVQTGHMPVFNNGGRRLDLGSRVVFEPEIAV